MSERTVELVLDADQEALIQFLLDPMNLRLWTVHRDLYWLDGKCHEASSKDGHWLFTEIKTAAESAEPGATQAISFTWKKDETIIKRFVFQLHALPENRCRISTELPGNLPTERIATLRRLLAIEFALLEQQLSSKAQVITHEDACFLQNYHRDLNA